ncbi:hypothetical protein SLS58_002483 [Diplodia intermedia]|uniref:Uncharacterized protein n=1 Tax=Diplodia intermedia TaxID=856260 RepID=A0ABR3TZG9_9PEZI
MIARGTTEECPGDMITLAKSVIANNGNADYEDMIYPATFDHVASTQQGMNATKGRAHVTGDAQGGGGGSGLGAATEPVSRDVGEHGKIDWNMPDRQKSLIYPRTAAQLAVLAELYANRIRSSCDDNDLARARVLKFARQARADI